jgi:histidyl-tRNA synthetase
LYLGSDKLKKQFRYASRREIPYVIVVGERELADKTVVLKDMVAQKQRTIPRSDLIPTLRDKL